jgi:large subunit ribosomal protein L17
MRHKFGHRKLNRTSEHRKALFKNMLNSLIKYEQITTTLPKAKELKPQIDKVITLGKKKNLQSKKNLFSKLQSKFSVDKLIKTLSQRYENRKGGYSRVIRAGFRYGDDAPLAVIELVDRDIQAKKVDIKKKETKNTGTIKETKIEEKVKKDISKK